MTDEVEIPLKYINTCQVCGKVYDMRIFRNGRWCGLRSKYCSNECYKVAARKRNVDSYARARVAEKSKGNTAPVGRPKSRGDYDRVGYSVGPLSGNTCFGCPMMGWLCRNQSVPPCREQSKYHEQYLRQIKLWKEVE